MPDSPKNTTPSSTPGAEPGPRHLPSEVSYEEICQNAREWAIMTKEKDALVKKFRILLFSALVGWTAALSFGYDLARIRQSGKKEAAVNSAFPLDLSAKKQGKITTMMTELGWKQLSPPQLLFGKGDYKVNVFLRVDSGKIYILIGTESGKPFRDSLPFEVGYVYDLNWSDEKLKQILSNRLARLEDGTVSAEGD